jgi:hypothetical protein
MNKQKEYKKEINILFSLIKQELGVDEKAMKSPSRKGEINLARRIFYNILYDIKKDGERIFSQSCVSGLFGRDRTTFIHHRRVHLRHIEKYKDYKEVYESIESKFIEKTKTEERCLINKEQDY